MVSTDCGCEHHQGHDLDRGRAVRTARPSTARKGRPVPRRSRRGRSSRARQIRRAWRSLDGGIGPEAEHAERGTAAAPPPGATTWRQGWRALSAAITAGSAATVTAATRATAVLLRTRPAPIVRTAAISQRRSTRRGRGTRWQNAQKQGPRSTPWTARTRRAPPPTPRTMTRLSRPVTDQCHAEPGPAPTPPARPAAMVDGEAPRVPRPIPGTQAIASMASG